jgi:capsular polysaccharide biosynthesis protein
LDRHFLTSFGSIFAGQRPKWNDVFSLGTACSLQNSFINYYHWILEQLPKLRAVEHYTQETGTEPILVLPPDSPSFVRETLALLDVDESSCIEWQGPALDVETLVVPSFPEANADNLHWLRTRLRRAAARRQESVSVSERIFISRKGARNHRHLRNEDNVLDTLERYGFERVFTEDYSIVEQIQMFSEAHAIASTHGAGLTNIIWADEATIIEFHNHVIRDYFYVLANNVGHSYVPIMAQSTDPHYLNSDVVVDTDTLEKRLIGILDQDTWTTS